MSENLSITSALSAEIVEKVADHFERLYVFPEVGTQLAARLRANLQQGAYNHLTDAASLVSLLTSQIRELNDDSHLRLDYHAEPQPPSTNLYADPAALASYWAKAALNNYGFQSVERLAGNVGYIKLTSIDEAEEIAPTIAAAMAFVAQTSALIIDIRQNNGGAPTGVAFLCSYFFGAEPVHLCDVYSRADNTVQQSWSYPFVPGKRYLDKPVYILTSTRTVSAAEELAYDLQALKRATIIGEATAGGAHLVDVYQLNPHFELRISTARAINPHTHDNWEGKGVIPDIAVAQEEALHVAHQHALRQVIQTIEQSSSPHTHRLLKEAREALH